MGEYAEHDIDYISGELAGIILAASIQTTDDTTFDKAAWRDLQGEDITYNSFPGYPSKEARQQQEDPLTIMKWDDRREVATLAEGAAVPTDRIGSIVFDDGTVVSNRTGEKTMFSLPDSLYKVISRLSDLRLKIIRDVYDYTPETRPK
ncbi:hypothetical protein [Halorarum salinum]|uniref:Uncharacterized protein n=1 Tax=Halorarum salinum TaxID=2743089 RepID=A0A7D5LAK4_9EURY|nr:hypothetical protein [Halobaculum salinum]QLG61911.1 hypothetical protein HUG12_09335 [Halobaculum salinum]